MVRKNGDSGPFMHSLHWLPKNKFFALNSMFFKQNYFWWRHFKIRLNLYTAIAFLPVSEFASLRFSQASIKPEKYGSGVSEGTFKRGCSEPALFSRNELFTKRMQFYKHIWDLKKRNSDYTIHSSILCKVSAPHRNSRTATYAPPKKSFA